MQRQPVDIACHMILSTTTTYGVFTIRPELYCNNASAIHYNYIMYLLVNSVRWRTLAINNSLVLDTAIATVIMNLCIVRVPNTLEYTSVDLNGWHDEYALFAIYRTSLRTSLYAISIKCSYCQIVCGWKMTWFVVLLLMHEVWRW